MEDTGVLQGKSNIHSEEGRVVVDVVQHHVTGGNLRGDLAKLNSKQNHGQTTGQKQIGRPGGEPVQRLTGDGGTAHLHNKDDENDEELTAHEVAVEVVTLVGHAANLVRDLVRVLVQLPVDGGRPTRAPWPPSTMHSQRRAPNMMTMTPQGLTSCER